MQDSLPASQPNKMVPLAIQQVAAVSQSMGTHKVRLH